MSSSREFILLFQLALAGLMIGLLFDLYRLGRWLFRPGRIGTYVGDILFWLLLTPVLFVLLLFTNGGELRLYVFAGLAGGCLLYFRLFSRRFLRLAAGLLRRIRRVAGGLERMVLGAGRLLLGRLARWEVNGWLGGLPPEPEPERPTASPSGSTFVERSRPSAPE
ncbi:MAG: spore cortex biosynthesis protein YabQ [Limnochordales bacterium]|nr:spore cortex biosynthesis protein YabQ [Limnochordales bacterium]